ncbi:hypothetical protein [Halosimplex halobium]|uniref:hypothetical protein n=1 Tax=Halosimplex halobium TaxID=3396618 RepID=UPI003F55BDDD
MRHIHNITERVGEFIAERRNRIGIAEWTAHAATLTALVLTFALSFATVELNPVAAWLFDTIGYPATGALAMVVVGLIFDAYRRLADWYPRTAEGGAWTIAAVGVVDVSVNLWRLASVGAPETTLMRTVWAIVGAGLLGVGSVIILRYRSVLATGAQRVTLPWTVVRTASVVGFALLVVLSTTAGLSGVMLSDDTGPSPVGKAQAAERVLIDDFSDGDFSEWDNVGGGWQASDGTARGNSSNGQGQLLGKNLDTSPKTITTYMAAFETVNSYDSPTFTVENENLNIITDVGFEYENTINASNKYIAEFDKRKYYRIDIRLKYEKNEYDVIVSRGGTVLGEERNISAQNNFKSVGRIRYDWGTDSSDLGVASVSYNGQTVIEETTPTPTPEPERTDYSLSVCYQGDAEFQGVGAEATWNPYPTSADNSWASSEYTGESSTTEFNRYGETTLEGARANDSVAYRVGVESDRAAFVFDGVNPTEYNTRGQFEIASPFEEWVTDPERIASSGVCDPEGTTTPTEVPTTIPGTPPGDGDLTALGTCTLPGANESKTGLLVEYWDPTMSTENIWFNLSYAGTSINEFVEFDSPKGYYFGCHGASEGGITPPDGGAPTPYPSPTAFPNGTEPTDYPQPTAYPQPEPPTLNGSANTTDGGSLNFSEIGFGDTDPANSLNGDLGAGFGPTGGGGGGSPVVGIALVGAVAYGALRLTGNDKRLAQAAQKAVGRLR